MFMFIGFKEFSIICVFLLLDYDCYPELAFIAVSGVKPVTLAAWKREEVGASFRSVLSQNSLAGLYQHM